MLSMNSLLLAIVILHSCHKISAIGDSDGCTNGFPDLDLVNTGEAKLVALSDSSLPADNFLSNFVQWIFPNVKFNCTGNISSWRMRVNISKQSEIMDRPIPQIATWRLHQRLDPLTLYILQSITSETWSTVTVIGDSNVFEYRPTQTIPVQAGDIVGITMPVNETEQKRSVKPVFLEGNASMVSCARVLNKSRIILHVIDPYCGSDQQPSLRHTPLLTAIIATTMAPTPPANPFTPQDRATTSTDPGLTTLPPDQSPGSTSNQVISVVIGAVLAAVAVVIIAVLSAILVLFIMNRRREYQRMLCDVPHTVAPRAQNLDNPIFTAEEKATKENWQLTEMKNNAAYISNTHNMLTEDNIAYYQQTMTQIPTEDWIVYAQIGDQIPTEDNTVFVSPYLQVPIATEGNPAYVIGKDNPNNSTSDQNADCQGQYCNVLEL